MRSCSKSLTVMTMTFVVIALAAASVTATGVMPLPPGEGGFTSPLSSRASCTLARTDGAASWFYNSWVIGDGLATLMNPVECGSFPTYPFEINTVDLTLYDDGTMVWPVTIDVAVYEALMYIVGDDTCWYLGQELCRQTAVCDQATFGYPTVGAVDFVDICCVYDRFFVSMEYVSGTTPLPSFLWDVQAPDTCYAWQNYGGVWVEQIEFWGTTDIGYSLIWVHGDTDSPNCEEDTCSWQWGDPHKMHYPQLPDTTGWDVNATWPVVLADDWRCTETGWIKDVHFWGSWRDGIQGYIQQFALSIHEDIPAGTACIDTTWATGDCNGDEIPLSVADLSYLIQYLFSGGPAPIPLWDSDLNGDCVVDSLDAVVYTDYFTYGLSVFDPYGGYPVPACCDTVDFSMPGELIWAAEIFNWDETAFDPGTLEGWYDPATGDVRWDNHTEYFQYNICLDSNYWFWQNLGDIYWLNITAMVEEPGTMWGWKSTQDHWNDDAVWDFQEVTPWQDLYEPGTGETWDTLYNAYGIILDNEGWLTDWYADDHYGEGFYYYDWYGWWNVWFYDHPYDPDRYKTGRVELFYVDAAVGGGPFYFEIAVNWSTDIWSLEFPEQGPPLPPTEEDMFIGRQVLFATANPIYELIVLEYEIPDYNPEWVSIDVRGYNFMNEGILVHECRPKLVTGQSLDLAFVITGEFPEDSTCCIHRGDINHDGASGGVPLIDDLVYLAVYMFQDGPPPPCDEPYLPDCPDHYYSEADINGDGSCTPLIDDLVMLVTYMFQNGPPPVPCP